MIAHVVSILRPIVDEVVVVASDGLELPPLDARVVRDREPARGPLAGIREGLEQIRTDFAFVTGTDAPVSLAGLCEETALVWMCCRTRNRRTRPDPGRRVSAQRVGSDRRDARGGARASRCKFSRNSVIENSPQRSCPICSPCAVSIRPTNTSKPFANRKGGRPPRSSFRGGLGWRWDAVNSRFQSARFGDVLAPFQPSIKILDGDVVANTLFDLVEWTRTGLQRGDSRRSRRAHLRPRRGCGALMAAWRRSGGFHRYNRLDCRAPKVRYGIMIQLTIDGVAVEVPEGTTIWDAARSAGIEIPVLCHEPRLEARGRLPGVCRRCRRAAAGGVLRAALRVGNGRATATAEIESHRKTLTELLVCDQPPLERDPKETTVGGNDLIALATRYEARRDRFPSGDGRPADSSSSVIAVDHQACILCDRCIRACDDLQNNEVMGRTGKGYEARIAFDLDRPMGESSCVSCGECVASCPTGALVDSPISAPLRPRAELTPVKSVCPYCGVGCAITYHVDQKRNAIVFAEGRESPGNQGTALREGALRLGLCAARAAPDGSVDPAR